jgi:hypothetical protein
MYNNVAFFVVEGTKKSEKNTRSVASFPPMWAMGSGNRQKISAQEVFVGRWRTYVVGFCITSSSLQTDKFAWFFFLFLSDRHALYMHNT